jgi:hypothetical protein
MTIARRQLAISPEEISSARRGFHCDSDVLRERLDEVGRSFVAGYLCAALHGMPAGVGSAWSHSGTAFQADLHSLRRGGPQPWTT